MMDNYFFLNTKNPIRYIIRIPRKAIVADNGWIPSTGLIARKRMNRDTMVQTINHATLRNFM